MKAIDWSWFGWQVGLPLIMPVGLAFAAALMWMSLDPQFSLNPAVVIDLSPWALTTYSLTLIGSCLREFWGRMQRMPVLGGLLLGVVVADTMYYALMVIRRHNPAFHGAGASFWVAGGLALASVYLCYRAR